MPRFAPVVVLVVAVVLMAGCADAAEPEPAAGSAAPSSLVSGSTPVDEPPGAITCARLAVAIERSTLMEPGVVDEINRLSGTADAPVADAAGRLAAAYAAAVNASGAANEPDRIAAVSAAASDMSGVCADSGLETVG
jgi:hypothetical protein